MGYFDLIYIFIHLIHYMFFFLQEVMLHTGDFTSQSPMVVILDRIPMKSPPPSFSLGIPTMHPLRSHLLNSIFASALPFPLQLVHFCVVGCYCIEFFSLISRVIQNEETQHSIQSDTPELVCSNRRHLWIYLQWHIWTTKPQPSSSSRNHQMI